MRYVPPSSGVVTLSGGGGGAVVVVGMKMHKPGRELLAWALENVVQSGDRVIALHVVDPDTDELALHGLMKSFASIPDDYECFCNLNQAEIKFKICKGSSARKVLVREAKSCGTKLLVTGTSAVNHRIRDKISVGDYCAKNLPKSISVISVDDDKLDMPGAEGITLPKSSGSHVHPELLSSASSDSEHASAFAPSKKQKLLQSKPRLRLLHSLSVVAQRAFGISSTKKALMAPLATRLPIPPHDSVNYATQNQSTASDGDVSHLDYGHVNFKPQGDANIHNNLLEELNAIRVKFSTSCKWFSYQELLLATDNFLPDNLIGKGGSCLVYRGCAPGGMALAVKILKPSKDVLEQFVSEVEILASMRHRNIISLVGLCIEEEKLLLVYNLLSRGSIEQNLHGTARVLGWKERYKAAVGVAKALDHLHNSAEPIIHRDVKSSNILLSDDFEPQLSDFGLATGASTSSHRLDIMGVAGTFGYLAPEYFFDGKLSEKADVYAFGVVLLELLSGRKPVDCESPKAQNSLVMWAKHIFRGGKISELQDPKLADSCNSDQFEQMAIAAFLCIRSSHQTRPGINTILRLLKCEREVVQWAKEEAQRTCDEADDGDDHQSAANIQSFLDLALRNLEQDSESSSSTEQGISVEDYLRGRQSFSYT